MAVAKLTEAERATLLADHAEWSLVRDGDAIYAVESKCPHAGGPLAKGYIEDGHIVCPLHRFKYDLKTGRKGQDQGGYLENYQVECREDGIYVGIPRKKFLGLF